MSIRILCLAGSTRKGSYNRKLAELAARTAAQAGAQANFIDLKDYDLPIYNADLEEAEGLPANAVALKDLFKSHQGIFIASPEYNGGMTPLLKNVIDWVSRKGSDRTGGEAYRGNVFAVAAASPGRYGGLRGLIMLRQSLTLALGAHLIPEQVAIPQADRAFAEDGGLSDKALADMLARQVRRLIEVAGALTA